MPEYRTVLQMARNLSHAGSHSHSVVRYHDLGTTMTVETKPLATQVKNDHSTPEGGSRDEEEVAPAPLPGMPYARSLPLVMSLIAEPLWIRKGMLRSGRIREMGNRVIPRG
jgi:hypothetical protein